MRAPCRLVLLIRGEIVALGLGWLRLANQALPALLAMPIAAACWLVGDGFASLPAVPTALAVGMIGLAALVVGLRTTRSGLTERDRQVVLNTVREAWRQRRQCSCAFSPTDEDPEP